MNFLSRNFPLDPIGKSLQCLETIGLSDFRFAHCVLQKFDGMIVHGTIDGIRVPVLSSMRKTESSGIAHARG